MPFATLACSSSDPDPSGDGGSGATSSGSTTSGSTTSAGPTSTSTATSGSGGADGSTTAASGSGGAGGSTGDGGGGGDTSSGEFTLTSPNHTEGAEFADKYTCAAAGFNGSLLPELNWTAGPPGTKSYAITFIDVTLTTKTPPNMNGYHWVIYNIPADVTSLPEEFKNAASIGAMQNSNYLGPCPNFGGGNANTDTYEFTIYALGEESVTITGTSTAAVKDAETKLEASHLAKAKLTGTSNASPP
ncbi:YbhB/YbcL family Raf kinase inhibitor-like protein [Sorangium cellulosum]|uniref:YbhB/YbcL family Raf kinase inhibitor-like protein n=1 Tax=Sorangium cellulosum TaxID=56 RepID=UPI003D9A932D